MQKTIGPMLCRLNCYVRDGWVVAVRGPHSLSEAAERTRTAQALVQALAAVRDLAARSTPIQVKCTIGRITFTARVDVPRGCDAETALRMALRSPAVQAYTAGRQISVAEYRPDEALFIQVRI